MPHIFHSWHNGEMQGCYKKVNINFSMIVAFSLKWLDIAYFIIPHTLPNFGTISSHSETQLIDTFSGLS